VRQVCNLTTYPHLMGFFRELGVDTEESDMSFALSTPEVEWGSRGLSAVFAQPGLWRSPQFLRMLSEVVAFGRQAPEAAAAGGECRRAGLRTAARQLAW
jgi:predicted NAD/FAD-binding protein